MTKILTLAFLLALVNLVSAQNDKETVLNDSANFPYWIDMMQDKNANFYATQRAFNLYWENRIVTRGSGWKPFKRWEQFMKVRVDEAGNRPKSDAVYNAYQELMKAPQNKNGTGNWNILGPVNLPNPESGQPNGLGRINVIAFHPQSQNTIYIGAPSGGFWRTTNNGASWETTTDRMPTLGVSAIVVDPLNPNIIYIGTGDRDAGDAPGMGVYKSFDGGTTWEPKSNGMGEITVNMMLIHPNYPEVVFAATENGIYKTIDGGETWNLKTSGTSKSLTFKPSNPDFIYATKSNSFYRSVDTGESWTKVSSGLTSWSRGVIAVTPGNPEFVYILASNAQSFKALYFSENSGVSFSSQSTTPNLMGWESNGSDDGGQAWYDLCIAVDQVDPKIVYTGGVNIWKSKDSGKTWKINAHWLGSGAPPVHADHHALAFNLLNNRLYTANDGGLYYTDNGGTAWTNNSSGISISQIYKIGQSATKRDWVLCGNQDNGTSYFKDNIWSVILGGDGMECLFDHTTEKYKFGSLYYGTIYRSVNAGGFGRITDNISEEGAWVTPYILNEEDPKIMYVGMKNIWRTTNVQSGTVAWTKISTSIANTSNFSVLENSPANSDILYAARENKMVFRAINANSATPTWTRLSNLPSVTITDIEAHPTDENIVYVTASNYQVYKSKDQGNTWSKITLNLPKVNYSTLVYDVTSNEGLYVGTDIGVFYKDATMPEWIYFSNGLPASAEVSELEIYYDAQTPANNTIRASTYGRGLWASPLYSEDITQAYNARFIGITSPKDLYNATDSIQASVTIKNIGINKIDTIAIEYQIDNNKKDTLFALIALETTKTAEILFPNFISEPGNHVFTARLIAANQTNLVGTISSNYSVEKNNWIQIKLVTDSLASETTWKVIDSLGNLVINSSIYINDSVYVVEKNLAFQTGCYKFVITDVNGICCSKGNGSYEVRNNTTDVLLGSGAEFTIADTISFCVDTFPNPDFKASKTSISVNQAITFENKTVDNGYSYNWFFGDGAVPANSEGFDAPEVSYTTGGLKNVSLMVKYNGNPVVKTNIGYINVYDEPVILLQPESVKLCPADVLKLSTDADGYGLTYTWYFNNVALTNQKNKDLKIENVQEPNVGTYYCKISNSVFTVTTDSVEVTLNTLPELSVTASQAEICKGSEVDLTATGNGTFNWSGNLGSNSQVTVSPTQSTTYYVSLTGDACTTSKEITVLVSEMPTYTVQSENKRVCEGQSVNFLVQAKGFGLTYKWQLNDEDFETGSNSLYIDSVQKDFQGYFKCIATNVCGSVSSTSAYLTVDPLPVAGFEVSVDTTMVTFIDTSSNAKTYLWDFGDGTTSTQIAPKHLYQIGTYQPLQEVTNDCGTDSISMKVIVVGVDIDDLLANEVVSVYPNPNNGKFNIYFESKAYIGTIKLEVVNIEGKIVMQQQFEKTSTSLSIPVNIASLAAGIYQLQVTVGNRMLHSKVVVN
ncbi:MAG: PKD domain-containing protein [Salinivirgaceae bacterium]